MSWNKNPALGSISMQKSSSILNGSWHHLSWDLQGGSLESSRVDCGLLWVFIFITGEKPLLWFLVQITWEYFSKDTSFWIWHLFVVFCGGGFRKFQWREWGSDTGKGRKSMKGCRWAEPPHRWMESLQWAAAAQTHQEIPGTGAEHTTLESSQLES